jgi:hypothetical protein
VPPVASRNSKIQVWTLAVSLDQHFVNRQLFDMEQTFCGFLVMEQDVVKPNLLVARLCNRIETFYVFHPTYQDTHV